MTLEHQQKHISILIYVGIAVATLVAYEPIRHNGFVNYDDDKYITKNPEVRGGITPESVIWAFTKTYASNWHPLTWLSHMLDCEIYGLNPLGHHITSVLIHTVNGLLLFWLLKKVTGAIWASGFVAAVFALHPVHVESVAWAAERKDMLSGLLWVLTILAYVRYTERPIFKRYALVLLTFGLGLMSKPMAVTLPFLLLLLDYWPLLRFATKGEPLEQIGGRRTEDGGQRTEDRWQKVSLKWLIIEKIPLLALSAISSIVTIIAQRSGGAVAGLENVNLYDRIANAFVSYISYIGKTIWPSRLAVIYPHLHTNFPRAKTAICALIFVTATVVIILAWRRKKYLPVGWLWYAGTLIPVIGLVQVGMQAMANRYMYIPMVGLLIIAAWGVKDIIVNRRNLQAITAITAAAILISLVILTRMQVRHWRDSSTLFEYTLEVTKNNFMAESNYGAALYYAGRYDEAELHMNNSIKINPSNFEARIILSKLLLNRGKFKEAEECLNKLLASHKNSPTVYYYLGAAYHGQGKFAEAIKCYNKSTRTDPEYFEAQNKIGMVLLAAGNPDEAIMHFKLALQTNTIPEDVYSNLGSAYIKVGKYDLAIANLTKAIELKPDNIDVLNKLAWLLGAVDDASIHNAQKAVEFARRGCELTAYKNPMLLDTLAVAYAATGRFDEAKTTARKALNIAKETGREKLAVDIQERIKFYETGQPYRQK